jgi:hypothetical protein
MPGVPTGGFLLQELLGRMGTQRWVKAKESAPAIFQEMLGQFRPELLAPFEIGEIRALLLASLTYWPHAYAMCVMSIEEGDREMAGYYCQAFLTTTSDKPYVWVESRRQELVENMKLIDAHDEVQARFNGIETEKLCALRFT